MLPFDYTFAQRICRAKNENPENLEALCGSGIDRRVGLRNCRTAPPRAIESKNTTGVLQRKEKERGFQKSHCEIRFARGSFARNNAHQQRRVGDAHRGRREQ